MHGVSRINLNFILKIMFLLFTSNISRLLPAWCFIVLCCVSCGRFFVCFLPRLKSWGYAKGFMYEDNTPTSVLILLLILILFFACFPRGVLSFFVVYRAGGFWFVFYPGLKAGVMQKVLCTKKLSPLPFSFSFSFCFSPASRVVFCRASAPWDLQSQGNKYEDL